uniref:Uncharacterized protein n=1 Tax=Caenorhabditis japonica TaxID=281687 RepID=A0A8R1IKA4_CAEJA
MEIHKTGKNCGKKSENGNLNKTFQKNYFDLGKLGLVLLKYDKLKYLDVTSYEQSLSYYCNYSVKVLPTVSSLGTLSPQVFQLAQTYMTNLLSHKNALLSKKEDKTPMLICTPSFIHVAQTFKGSHPFKTQVEVSMRGLGQVPNGIQRAISWIIKNVLSQILDDPVAHQQYSVRAMPERNTKTSCKELPFNVLYFIKDYVLSSFGYPPALRFPGYTYQQLAAESPLLASELGATSEECEERFPKLVADADVFDNLVFDKIQRLFNDLRKSVLQETCHVHDNYEYRRCEFVRIDKGT